MLLIHFVLLTVSQDLKQQWPQVSFLSPDGTMTTFLVSQKQTIFSEACHLPFDFCSTNLARLSTDVTITQSAQDATLGGLVLFHFERIKKSKNTIHSNVDSVYGQGCHSVLCSSCDNRFHCFVTGIIHDTRFGIHKLTTTTENLGFRRIYHPIELVQPQLSTLVSFPAVDLWGITSLPIVCPRNAWISLNTILSLPTTEFCLMGCYQRLT